MAGQEQQIDKATVVAMGFQPDEARTGNVDLADGFWKCPYIGKLVGFYYVEVTDGFAIEWH